MSNTSSLMDLLFGDYRQRALAVLLLQPDTSFHGRELARLIGCSAGTLTRELGKLASATELAARLAGGDRFASRVLSDSRIFVIGGADELGELAGDRAPASAHA